MSKHCPYKQLENKDSEDAAVDCILDSILSLDDKQRMTYFETLKLLAIETERKQRQTVSDFLLLGMVPSNTGNLINKLHDTFDELADYILKPPKKALIKQKIQAIAQYCAGIDKNANGKWSITDFVKYLRQ
jgi:hypothetical protein